MIEIEKPRIDTEVLSADGTYGKFVVEPLEGGFGTTECACYFGLFLGGFGGFFFDFAFFARDADDGGQRVGFVEGHDADALRIAADDVEVADFDALDFSTGRHHH